MNLFRMTAGLTMLFLAWPDSPRAQEFPCPNPSQQTETNIKGEVDAKAQTFLKLGGAELKGNVEKTIVDLFSKYPNADRVATINTILSTTCYMIKNSKHLNDNEKFDKWIAVLPVIRTFLPEDKKSEHQIPALNLEAIELGMRKEFTESLLGKSKFIRKIEIREDRESEAGKFRWVEKKEHHYRHAGFDVRIVFDDDGQAISIFVGIQGDENLVQLANFGTWPIELKGSMPIAWSALTFNHVGNENCSQWVNTAASASVVSIACEYSYRPAGASSYTNQICLFSSGYSDGAYGVRLVRNRPSLSSFDLQRLYDKGASDAEVQKFTWNEIKNKGFNYLMVTCNAALVKTDWN